MTENPAIDSGRSQRPDRPRDDTGGVPARPTPSGRFWIAAYRLAVLALLGLVAWHTAQVRARIEWLLYPGRTPIPVVVEGLVDAKVIGTVNADVTGTVDAEVIGTVDANVTGFDLGAFEAVPVEVRGTVDANVTGFDWAGPLQRGAVPVRVE
ncbi:MAG TPA: hypothetical protein PLU35_14745 [Phycisphaerales bacterium]|nr:hypothetical protein [Phycisphaerales bacterium]